MNILQKLYNWFYYPLSARVAALFRIALGTVTLLTVLLYAGELEPFFSEQGYVSARVMQMIHSPQSGNWSLLFVNDSLPFVRFLYVLLLIACVMLILGLWSRIAAFVAYVLYFSFFTRFPVIAFDGSQVLIMALLFASFIQTDKAFILPWYGKKYGYRDTVSGWGARMIQMQLAIIYFFAGSSKIQSITWRNGTELLSVLHFQYATFNFNFLIHLPLLVNLLTWMVFLAESLFIFNVWFPNRRLPTVLLMMALHMGILFSLQVTYFSEAMIACLLIFLTDQDLNICTQLGQKIKSWLQTHFKTTEIAPVKV